MKYPRRIFTYVTGKINSGKTNSLSAWCSDPGAYPVMAIIPFTVVFAIGCGVYIMLESPDARVHRNIRKQPFRGDLEKEFEKDSAK